MRHIWTEPEPKRASLGELRAFRCAECGESVSITCIKALNELGSLVLQYPLGVTGCLGSRAKQA